MTGSGIVLPGNADMNIMAIFISHIILKTVEGFLKFYRGVENVV